LENLASFSKIPLKAVRPLRFILVLFLLLGVFPSARAHELQPVYLELRQTGAETYSVLWKVPARLDLQNGVEPQFPVDCKITAGPTRYTLSGAQIERFEIFCPGGLAGRAISLSGPAAPVADVLIQFIQFNGKIAVFRLNPTNPQVVLTASPNFFAQSVTYIKIGVTHILTGVDHLLFVLGLLLLVHDGWMLLKTITAFTLAHSITLAVATLGYASAPLPPLYAAIALSILFLGPEIMRERRGETSLTIRHPWLVAFSFGLLHGFGFASGLVDLGLARSEIPWALLCFNVGVEIGQLFFVALILLLVRSFRTLQIQWPRWAQALPVYTIGSLGAYWTIQRTVILFQSVFSPYP
jgi:hydrogenase/urease accessory protein HupE